MMYWHNGHLGSWGWALMSVGLITFWVLLIAVIVVLMRWLDRSGQRPTEPPTAPSAEQILADRLARGQIDETEYRRRIAMLRDRPDG
jgi:putative membrane protein